MGSLMFLQSAGDHISQFLGTKSGKSAVGWMCIEMLKTETHHVYGDLATSDSPL